VILRGELLSRDFLDPLDRVFLRVFLRPAQAAFSVSGRAGICAPLGTRVSTCLSLHGWHSLPPEITGLPQPQLHNMTAETFETFETSFSETGSDQNLPSGRNSSCILIARIAQVHDVLVETMITGADDSIIRVLVNILA
jgi:hypothetical protein